jgi:hypothetical protein
MTDSRDLIQRLAKEMDTWLMAHHYGGVPPEIQHATTLVAEARAYLAQPEPERPTDEEMDRHKDSKPYDQAVSDCWSYLYYEIGMKDFADKMHDWIYSQQKAQSDD